MQISTAQQNWIEIIIGCTETDKKHQRYPLINFELAAIGNVHSIIGR
jgi:hypothetical protein